MNRKIEQGPIGQTYCPADSPVVAPLGLFCMGFTLFVPSHRRGGCGTSAAGARLAGYSLRASAEVRRGLTKIANK